MNRFQPFALRGVTEEAVPEAATASGEVVPGGGQPTAFFTPLHYEPNYAYPLLVWLHSPGEEETQLRQVMPLVSLRNYAAVSVRGTIGLDDRNSPSGYTWSQAAAHVAAAEQAVFEAIEQASRRFNIAGHRTFLAGHASGGTMALRIALAHPDKFAGVLSLGGELPQDRRPFSRLDDLRQLPVFLACSLENQRYPSPAVCDNLRLLHSAGVQVALRLYLTNDDLVSQMLEDMDRWMMELIVGASTASAANA